MKKYKVWLHIEEIDEDEDHYVDLDEHTCSIGKEFNTPQGAINLKDLLVEYGGVHLTECECDNTHTQNNTVCRFCWDNANNVCPICQSELMFGPNGSTICSKDDCGYWRE